MKTINPDENPLIVGCNYHTTWQRHRNMRFVLDEIKGEKVVLKTRKTNKRFTTNAKDLIFIKTNHNINKANRLTNK